jgi:hypothetical protein
LTGIAAAAGLQWPQLKSYDTCVDCHLRISVQVLPEHCVMPHVPLLHRWAAAVAAPARCRATALSWLSSSVTGSGARVTQCWAQQGLAATACHWGSWSSCWMLTEGSSSSSRNERDAGRTSASCEASTARWMLTGGSSSSRGGPDCGTGPSHAVRHQHSAGAADWRTACVCC